MNPQTADQQMPRPEMDFNEVLAAVHNHYGQILANQAQQIAMLTVQLSDKEKTLQGQSAALASARRSEAVDRVRVTARDDEALPPNAPAV
jgi:hypothetical protein